MGHEAMGDCKAGATLPSVLGQGLPPHACWPPPACMDQLPGMGPVSPSCFFGFLGEKLQRPRGWKGNVLLAP